MALAIDDPAQAAAGWETDLALCRLIGHAIADDQVDEGRYVVHLGYGIKEYIGRLPAFSTDDAVALGLAAWLRDQGWLVDLRWMPDGYHFCRGDDPTGASALAHRCLCLLTWMPTPDVANLRKRIRHHPMASADTLALAVSRAALMTEERE